MLKKRLGSESYPECDTHRFQGFPTYQTDFLGLILLLDFSTHYPNLKCQCFCFVFFARICFSTTIIIFKLVVFVEE